MACIATAQPRLQGNHRQLVPVSRLNTVRSANECKRLWVLKKSIFFEIPEIWEVENV